jgi:hypothetical protein
MHRFGFHLCIRILDGFLKYSALTFHCNVSSLDIALECEKDFNTMQGCPYQMIDWPCWCSVLSCYNCCYGSATKLLLWLLLLHSLNTSPRLLSKKIEGKELMYVVTLCGLFLTTSSGRLDIRQGLGSTMSTSRHRRGPQNYQLNGTGSSSKVHL